ncbi:MAG: anthranilate synthase component I family protein [Planctomycetaceae bacterium]|nr:anthranilate synthase component I family protein [Planctomycetaceae bacterium]
MNDSDETKPLVHEFATPPDPWETCQKITHRPGLIFFDSALRHAELGRYSFLTASPIRKYELQTATYGLDPFAAPRKDLSGLSLSTLDGLPPFQGGIAGMLSYELNECFEKVPSQGRDEFQTPVLAAGLYDWVIAWDHEQNRAWLISHGLDPESLTPDSNRARRCLDEILSEIESSDSATALACDVPPKPLSDSPSPVGLQEFPELHSDFRRDDYLRSVEQVVEYICAGDIFQANLSQRLLHPLTESVLDLYGRLRTVNSATYAGLMLWNDWAIASASPEQFLEVRGRDVETRPIKGTRRRGMSPEAELYTGDELRESSKEMAENVMITDLLRNDLSRVCRPGTVHAPELCRVETYATVQHLVSVVRGQLKAEHDAWDLLSATFPGGSITGAPKVRAMEIITELEPTARGPYCGTLFYLGHDGSLDSNILIRSFIVKDGWIQCRVGGGITAKSSPAAEYQETLHKAEGMLRALKKS